MGNSAFDRSDSFVGCFSQTLSYTNDSYHDKRKQGREAECHIAVIFIQSMPVYFEYEGKTWLLECWKGQYGITVGAEIGLYYVDAMIEPKEYANTRFTAVSDDEMVHFESKLLLQEEQLFFLRSSRVALFWKESLTREIGLHASIVNVINGMWVRLFHCYTRPFHSPEDQALFLYMQIPFFKFLFQGRKMARYKYRNNARVPSSMKYRKDGDM